MDYSIFSPLTDNSDVINNFLDMTLQGDYYTLETPDNKLIRIYDFMDDFFGLRLITDDKKDPIAFYPIYETGKSVNGELKNVGEFENKYEAVRSFSLINAYLTTFALDHVDQKNMLPSLLGKKINFSLAAFIYSQDKQLDPPTIKQQDGSVVSTKNSSIFYNLKDRPLFDYIYQFKIDKIKSIYWNDFIEILQLKTILIRFPDFNVEAYLYVSERVLQNNYYPRPGDNVMGIMQLASKLF